MTLANFFYKFKLPETNPLNTQVKTPLYYLNVKEAISDDIRWLHKYFREKLVDIPHDTIDKWYLAEAYRDYTAFKPKANKNGDLHEEMETDWDDEKPNYGRSTSTLINWWKKIISNFTFVDTFKNDIKVENDGSKYNQWLYVKIKLNTIQFTAEQIETTLEQMENNGNRRARVVPCKAQNLLLIDYIVGNIIDGLKPYMKDYDLKQLQEDREIHLEKFNGYFLLSNYWPPSQIRPENGFNENEPMKEPWKRAKEKPIDGIFGATYTRFFGRPKSFNKEEIELDMAIREQKRKVGGQIRTIHNYNIPNAHNLNRSADYVPDAPITEPHSDEEDDDNISDDAINKAYWEKYNVPPVEIDNSKIYLWRNTRYTQDILGPGGGSTNPNFVRANAPWRRTNQETYDEDLIWNNGKCPRCQNHRSLANFEQLKEGMPIYKVSCIRADCISSSNNNNADYYAGVFFNENKERTVTVAKTKLEISKIMKNLIK